MNRSSLQSESLFDALIRVQANEEKEGEDDSNEKVLDFPLIQNFGLIIIDWSQNSLIAINLYIFKLCKKVLLLPESTKSKKSIQAMTQCQNDNRVFIFDGLNAFDLVTFQQHLPCPSLLNKILFVNEADPFKLLSKSTTHF